jgi:hypothetical protein
MAERKKVERQELKQAETKKREVVKPKEETKKVVVEKPKSTSVIDITLEPEVEKRSRSENKYIRLSMNPSAEEKFSINEKIKKGDIKFAFYGIDGEKGYFYYKKIVK